MASKKKKRPEKVDWLVTADIEMSGVTIIIEACSEEEAITLVENGEWSDGFDTSTASITNITFCKASKNE